MTLKSLALMTVVIVIGGTITTSAWTYQQAAPNYHAVYSREFALKNHLPESGIDNTLSNAFPFFDAQYNVIPSQSRSWCEAGFLAAKPHDLAEIPTEFKNGVMVGTAISSVLNGVKSQGVKIDSLEFGGSGYPEAGFRMTAGGYYISDIVPGYDYFYGIAPCSVFARRPSGEKLLLRSMKASVWGRKERLHKDYDAPDYPNKNFEQSFEKLIIPDTLTKVVLHHK